MVGYIQKILDKLSWSVRTMIFMRELGDIYSTFWAKVIFWLELNKTSKFHYKRNYIKRVWKRKRRCIFIVFFFWVPEFILHRKWEFAGEMSERQKERARKQAPIKIELRGLKWIAVLFIYWKQGACHLKSVQSKLIPPPLTFILSFLNHVFFFCFSLFFMKIGSYAECYTKPQ